MRRTRTIHGQSAPKCSNAILGDSNKSFADNQKLGRGGGDRRDTPNSKSHRSMALQPLLSAIVDFVDLGESSICTFPITPLPSTSLFQCRYFFASQRVRGYAFTGVKRTTPTNSEI